MEVDRWMQTIFHLHWDIFLMLLLLKYILKWQYRAGNGAGVKIRKKLPTYRGHEAKEFLASYEWFLEPHGSAFPFAFIIPIQICTIVDPDPDNFNRKNFFKLPLNHMKCINVILIYCIVLQEKVFLKINSCRNFRILPAWILAK